MAEQEITLEPSESRVVSFEATPHEARTYQVSVDGLTGSFMAMAPPFDPWVYDVNGDGYIDKAERAKAASDYFAGIITKEQVNQVFALPSPPTPPACATKAEKLKAVKDYFDGLITKEEVEAILSLPTCPE